MKKLMFVFALCAMAFSAQAVSFTWKSNNMVDSTGAILQTAPDNGEVVLVYLGQDAGALNWEGAQVVQAGKFDHFNKKGKESAVISQTLGWKYHNTAPWDNGDIFGVMFKDLEGNLSFLKNASDKSDIKNTFTLSGISADNTPLGAFTFADGDFYADPTPVPEPTCAALIALGLAAFGLKRKVRA